MNTTLLFIFACGLLGLFYRQGRGKGYLISVIGAAAVAGAYLGFSGLMG